MDASHVRPEKRYRRPPGGSGLRRRGLRRVRKSLDGRYYQLISGYATLGSFLHERMTGSLCLESNECRWCGSGKREFLFFFVFNQLYFSKRESRHHLFTECQALIPQIRRLWKRVGKDCRWKHPRHRQ